MKGTIPQAESAHEGFQVQERSFTLSKDQDGSMDTRLNSPSKRQLQWYKQEVRRGEEVGFVETKSHRTESGRTGYEVRRTGKSLA